MLPISRIRNFSLGMWALIFLVLATRAHSNHFGSPVSLPDASLAVFFMAGLWFASFRLFVILLAEAALIDYVAITQMGVSSYCVSPAYVFLIPSYAVVFIAGHMASKYEVLRVQDMLMQLSLVVASVSVAFFISNSSFYLLSGRFPDLSWGQYLARVVQYYPSYLATTLEYCVGLIGLVKLVQLMFPLNNANHSTIKLK